MSFPPAEMQRGFILNLPAGRYTVRLINPDGTIAEGSERAVIVHTRGRTGGVGFEIIPSDKWTRPAASVTPSSTIYANGAADLYLRPFFEDEYNDLFYARTVDNAAPGNSSIARWVRVQQVPRAGIIVKRPGRDPEKLSEKPFVVEQSQGNALGYTITPWDPNGSGKDKQPNLVAFPVPLRDGVTRVSLSAVDARGEPLAGSGREIRIVHPLQKRGGLIALALSPLLLMTVVLVARARGLPGKAERGKRRSGRLGPLRPVRPPRLPGACLPRHPEAEPLPECHAGLRIDCRQAAEDDADRRHEEPFERRGGASSRCAGLPFWRGEEDLAQHGRKG